MKKIYVNKEISWLSFNARVLQEAMDRHTPLVERLRFLGIFSSNLDEFFRIRVATLRRLTLLGTKAIDMIGHDPRKVLKEIQRIVLEQQKQFDAVYQQTLIELEREHVYLVNESQLSPTQKEFVLAHFQRLVRSHLIPLMVDSNAPFPNLRDQSTYLAVALRRSGGDARYAIIEVPTQVCSRFLILPQEGKKRYLMILDDVIRLGLADIFAVLQYTQYEAFAFKITRDGELDLDDDEPESVIRKVHKSLKKRKSGNPVRLVYDSALPRHLLSVLTKKLSIQKDDTLVPGGRYHNFRDFMRFPDFGEAGLRYPPQPALFHPDIDRKRSILKQMTKRDILLHFPYQSFDHFIDLLRECSIDPNVTAVKVTVYRVAQHSSVMNALMNAARNGKAVTVVLEVQARFDEEANLSWGDRLQEDGVRVIFGVPGLKVHSKLCLITRLQKGHEKLYAAVGTGNFNEETAQVYGDHILLTADPRITGDVQRMFQFFERNYKVPSFQHLTVAPFSLRKTLNGLIKEEIENAAKGRRSGIFLKLNNLSDPEIIHRLYEASAAGVPVRLIVRSMLSLAAGVKGLSENIEAVSILDRYLEHSRVFIFESNGSPRYFISSADLMPRNLDRRVEVVCPIYSPEAQKQLRQFLDLQWKDNVKARFLTPEMENIFRPKGVQQAHHAQAETYRALRS